MICILCRKDRTHLAREVIRDVQLVRLDSYFPNLQTYSECICLHCYKKCIMSQMLSRKRNPEVISSIVLRPESLSYLTGYRSQPLSKEEEEERKEMQRKRIQEEIKKHLK